MKKRKGWVRMSRAGVKDLVWEVEVAYLSKQGWPYRVRGDRSHFEVRQDKSRWMLSLAGLGGAKMLGLSRSPEDAKRRAALWVSKHQEEVFTHVRVDLDWLFEESEPLVLVRRSDGERADFRYRVEEIEKGEDKGLWVVKSLGGGRTSVLDSGKHCSEEEAKAWCQEHCRGLYWTPEG